MSNGQGLVPATAEGDRSQAGARPWKPKNTGCRARWHPPAQNPTTSVLTATVLVCATGAGITAAAGTRLALQLLLIDGFGCHPLQSPLAIASRDAIFRRCLASVGIGQFARLLPTLVVVAVSQAPSPESNPHSPLPVGAVVVHYTTIRADRAECRPRWHQRKADVLSQRLACITQELPLLALVFVSASGSLAPHLRFPLGV